MNFLELCQMAHRYISGGNAPPGTAPLDVSNQQGELYSLVQSIKESYLDIQNDQPSWLFMMRPGQITLPANSQSIKRDQLQKVITDYQRLMPLLGDGNRYIQVREGASVTSGGIAPNITPTPVTYIPYQQWRGFKDRPPIRTGKPAYFTILPDDTIQFDCISQAIYTLLFDYRIKPLKLTANTDVPVFDEDYHSVVAWRAVHLWGGRQEAANKFQFATAEYDRVMGDMRARYLPETVFSVGEFYGQNQTTS